MNEYLNERLAAQARADEEHRRQLGQFILNISDQRRESSTPQTEISELLELVYDADEDR